MAVGTALMYYVGARQVLWRSHLGRLDRLRELSSLCCTPEQLSYGQALEGAAGGALFRGPRSRGRCAGRSECQSCTGRNEISNFGMSASVTPVTDSF